MTERTQVYRFTGGEMAPAFYGGTDLEKYGIGIAKGKNCIIDFRGGVKNRTGFEFLDFIREQSRIFTFSVAEAEQDILLIFSEGFIHFMQDGRYVLDTLTDETITGVAANVLTFASHTFVVGDLVYVEDSTLPDAVYVVTAATATTITVELLNGIIPDNEGVFVTGTVTKTLSVTNFYTQAVLDSLRFKQRQREVFITSPLVDPSVLTFNGASWTFSILRYEQFLNPPTNVTLSPSAAGSARIVYCVTSVDAEGNESPFAIPVKTASSVNFPVTAGSLSLRWTHVTGAVLYRIYRSNIAENSNINTAAELGFIGETSADSFVDSNIVPDFTRQPPRYVNPFATLGYLDIGYTSGSTYGETDVPIITLSGFSGSNFLGYFVIANGTVADVVVLNPGRGYITEPSVNVSIVGGGSPLILTPRDRTPADGIFPAVAESFQQRMVFGGTLAFPMTLWGTKVGSTKNFSVSNRPAQSDAFSFTVDADELAPIRHLVRQTNGLLIMHKRGVDKLTGAQGDAVGPGNANIRQEVAIGVGAQPPLAINNDVVFVADAGTGLVSLAYTFYSNSYQPLELSVLSGHLFPPDNQPVRMAWHDEPDKLVWVQREDGTALTLTYLRDQEVYAWTHQKTRGYFEDFTVLTESGRRKLYAIVRRWINGRFVFCIERQRERMTAKVENFFGVDCGLSSDNVILTGAANLELETVGDDLFAQSVATPFGSIQAEDVLYIHGGRYQVLEVVSTSRLRILEELAPTDYFPESDILLPTSDWEILRPSDVVSNLWHIEGETVSVLADGDATLDLVVENGQVQLSNPAAVVHVGLPYESDLELLPLATYGRVVGDGRKKRPTGIALRLQNTRGLETGILGGPLYEMKDRGFEAYGQVTGLQNGVSMISVAALWEQDVQLRFRQRYPLPMTILGLVAETEIEDA